MMVLWQLFYEFFKAGLFAIGGGLATLPFLYDIARRYDWLPLESMPDMIAVSESTPGPIGINMATYAGYNAYGVLGAVVATFSLVLPSFLIILIVARLFGKFNEKPLVQNAFAGLRPAVTGLIAAVVWQVLSTSVLRVDLVEATGRWQSIFDVKALVLFAVLLPLVLKFKKHPLWYIAGAAAVGIVCKF